MSSFNWVQQIEGVTNTNVHIATSFISVGLMVVLASLGRLALGKGKESIVPAHGFSFKGIFEQLTEFNANLAETVIGHDGRPFVPMFTTIFFFIFINNIFGLFPGMAPATDNINTGMAVGLFIFIVYNGFGFYVHGLGYLKQFMGPIWWLAPMIFAVELLSHLVRPLTLGLRLKANMVADHTLLGVFTELVPYIVPIPFYFMGLFVSAMQAFVFTVLSMIYVAMAMSHDH